MHLSVSLLLAALAVQASAIPQSSWENSSFQHISLLTDDLNRAVEYYRRLGFRDDINGERPHMGFDGAWLRFPISAEGSKLDLHLIQTTHPNHGTGAETVSSQHREGVSEHRNHAAMKEPLVEEVGYPHFSISVGQETGRFVHEYRTKFYTNVTTVAQNGKQKLVIGGVRPGDRMPQLFLHDPDGNAMEIAPPPDTVARSIATRSAALALIHARSLESSAVAAERLLTAEAKLMIAEQEGHVSRASGQSVGAVAFGNPIASRIAMRTLRRGGSAADAFIAASAALAVVEPMNCGIGGDLFATIYEPAPPGSGRRGKVVGLNASGPLGSKVTREVIQDIIASIEYDKDPAYQDQPIPLNGAAAAITVPGAVGGWCALHAKHGKLPWQDLFQPAISLAMQGFNVSLHTWRNWNGLQEANRVRKSGQLTSQQYLDFMSVYAPGGITPLPGEFMRNPALGRTLSMIARGGCDEFYRGTIAKEMGEYMKSVGGLLTAADFAAYWPAPPTTVPTHSSHKAAAVDVYSSPSVEWVEPLCTTYKRGQYEVHGMPGNSQALAGLQMLSVLDEYDGAYLATHPLHRTYVLVALKRIVYTYDRALYGGDGPLPPGLAPATDAPGCKSRGESLRRVLGMTPAEIKAMIDESFHAGQPFPIERVAKYAAALRTARAGKTRESHKRWLMNDRVPQGAGDTVAMVVRDGSGLTISSLQSVCGSFGSKLVSPDLGFALQNRGTKFNLLDSVTHPNGLLPGRRPHHTLSPWIVTHADSGLPFLAAAMKGGDRQPYAFLQMFSNLVDLQMPLSHAIAAPRFRHVVHSEPTAHQPVSSFTSGLLRGAAGPSLESFTNTSIQVEGGYPLSGDDLVALKTTYGISVKTIKANYPFADSGFGICQALLVTYPAQQDEPQDQQAPSGAGSTKIAVTVEAAADAVRKPGLAIALDGPRLDDAAASKSSSSTSRH